MVWYKEDLSFFLLLIDRFWGLDPEAFDEEEYEEQRMVFLGFCTVVNFQVYFRKMQKCFVCGRILSGSSLDWVWPWFPRIIKENACLCVMIKIVTVLANIWTWASINWTHNSPMFLTKTPQTSFFQPDRFEFLCIGWKEQSVSKVFHCVWSYLSPIHTWYSLWGGINSTWRSAKNRVIL